MYRPLPKNVTIKKSNIDGLGLFATEVIEKGINLGITHVFVSVGSFEDDLVRTPLGGFVNHSDSPNCKILIKESGSSCCGGGTMRPVKTLQTMRDVEEGEELTVKYEMYNVSG